MHNDSYNNYLNGTVIYDLGENSYGVILDQGVIVTAINYFLDYDIFVGDSVELISSNTPDNYCYISGVKRPFLKTLYESFKS